MNLLENMALDGIKFSPDGKNLTCDFINTYDGEKVASLLCRNTFYFEYQNGFEEYDGFAAFIHEVCSEELSKKQTISRLKERKYSFVESQGGDISLPNQEYYHIYFQSNEVIIDIFCDTYLLEKI